MIGQLILPASSTGRCVSADRDGAVTVSLDDHLRWRSDDPSWASLLNDRFPAPMDARIGPAAGRFLLYRAAERLSARVVLDAAQHEPEAVA